MTFLKPVRTWTNISLQCKECFRAVSVCSVEWDAGLVLAEQSKVCRNSHLSLKLLHLNYLIAGEMAFGLLFVCLF